MTSQTEATSFRRRFQDRLKLTGREKAEQAKRHATARKNAPIVRFEKRTDAIPIGEHEATDERALDVHMSARAFRESSRNIAAVGIQKLRVELNQFEMLFVKGDEELIPSPSLQRLVANSFKPMQDDALLAILCIGVVPIAFRRNPTTNEVIPYVPPPGSYTITIQTLRGVRLFNFYWVNPSTHFGSTGPPRFQKETGGAFLKDRAHLFTRTYTGPNNPGDASAFGSYDPSVVVIANMGYDPLIDGTLQSVMAGAMQYIDSSASLRNDMRSASSRLARPDLVTESNPSDVDRVRNRSSAADKQFFVGSDVLQTNADGTSGRRTEHSTARTPSAAEAQRAKYRRLAAEYGEQHVRDTYDLEPDDYRELRETTCDFNSSLNRNEIAVAEGRRVVSNPTQPHINPQTMAGLSYFDERILMLIGTPLQAWSGGASVREGAAEVTRTLNATVQHFQKLLSPINTIVYNHIFLEEDIFEHLRAHSSESKSRSSKLSSRYPPLIDEEDLFSDKIEAVGVRLSYRYTPTMSLESLNFMYARGLITWTTYAYLYLQITGLEPTNIASETDPLPQEASRMVGLPGYERYAQMEETREAQERAFAHQRKMAKDAQAHQDKQQKAALDAGPQLDASAVGGGASETASTSGDKSAASASSASKKRKAPSSAESSKSKTTSSSENADNRAQASSVHRATQLTKTRREKASDKSKK